MTIELIEGSFPRVRVSGNALERGQQHGSLLKERIKHTVDYYKEIFQQTEEDIFQKAAHFRQVIREYKLAYSEEIEGIAQGADINPLWIYALNARTEIIPILATECTSLYFQSSAILGQTWDWSESLEDLAVILQIEDDEQFEHLGITTFTEPGILAKIGFNSAGVGVCLNFLNSHKPRTGVPVHIVLRAVLESNTIEQARQVLASAGLDKASNILVGDCYGNCLNVEFAGDESFSIEPEGGVMLHTNHYLAEPITPERGLFLSSFQRYRSARAHAEILSNYSIEEAKNMLLDNSHPQFPIQRSYLPDPDLGNVGTVATLLMDLKRRQLHVKKGNTSASRFQIVNGFGRLMES